jgi:hypothetical protein
MLDDGALAVSLPANELGGMRLPGSVFQEADLTGARFSAPLARALDIVRASAAFAGVSLVFVARPEILAHGDSLAWLRARLGPVRRHLALSDGTTLKKIPGLENYAFFHGLARRADREALAGLQRRAPELFTGLAGQVNTGLTLASAAPASIVLEGSVESTEPAAYFRVACDAGSLDDSVARTLSAGPQSRLPSEFGEMTYVTLTESSLDDPHFLRWMADEAGRCYFGRPRALLIRLPESVGHSAEIGDRLRAALAGLRDGGARVPLAPAYGVWFAAGDPTVSELEQASRVSDLVAPASFDFWRAPPPSYRGFRSVVVHVPESSRLGENFESVIEALTGIAPSLAQGAAAGGFGA